MPVIEVCDRVDTFCPGCRVAKIDMAYRDNATGGTLTLEHELPICAWWATPEAKRWAIELVSDVLEAQDGADPPRA